MNFLWLKVQNLNFVAWINISIKRFWTIDKIESILRYQTKSIKQAKRHLIRAIQLSWAASKHKHNKTNRIADQNVRVRAAEFLLSHANKN